MGRRERQRRILLWALLALAAATLGVAPFVGMHRIGPASILAGSLSDRDAGILWQVRVPRVGLAFVAGAALGVAGMAFQAMFRNPLATPYTLGVSSGASLGAALSVVLGLRFVVLGIGAASVFAFGGALGSIVLVYGLTRTRRGFSTSTMLLAGIAVSLFFSSMILFLQYLGDFTQSYRILHWLMGSLDVLGFAAAGQVLPFAVSGAAILFLLTRELDLMTVGDDIAVSRGVDVRNVKKVIFAACSLMVGGVVAVCGPIGFVGMMAPHVCRLLTGPNHRYLMPATLLFGGTFLTVCDALARTLIAPAEIPVGVITSLLGGPFFVWLLLSNALARSGLVED